MSLPGTSPFDAFLPEVWLAIYLGILCMLPVLILSAACLRIRGRRQGLRFRHPLPPAQVSAEMRRHGQPWVGRLGFLGFAMQECVRIEHPDSGETYEWHLTNAADQTLAVLEGARAGAGEKPVFSLRLMTFLSDGRLILTADGPLTHRPPSHWILSPRRDFDTVEGQIAAHRTTLAASAGGAAAVLPAPQALAGRLTTEEHAMLAALVASGDFVPAKGEGHEIRPVLSRLPALAFRHLAALFTGSGRRRDLASVSKRKSDEGPDSEAPESGTFALSPEQLVERDVQRFRELTGAKQGAKRLVFKAGVLAATLFAGTWILGKGDLAAGIASLLAIIAIHEFGHWLAMKSFGYTGMGRFFIPFFGSVDLGKKLHAPAWQQLVVILAGPVPGLLAGLFILIAGYFLPDPPSRLLDAAGLALLYNGFHLLPFLPLDGGKVVDLLIFRDLPVIRPMFTACSAALALIASFLLKSRAVRYIAIGMFGGLIWDIRMIRVVRGGRKLGWAGQTDNEEEALQRIFTGVRQEQNDSFMRSSDWSRQIEVLLAEVLRKRPGIATRIFGGAFYAGVCLLPLVLIAGGAVFYAMGGIENLMAHAAAGAEFRAAFPMKEDKLPPEKHEQLAALVEATHAATTDAEEAEYSLEEPSAAERPALAAKAAAAPEVTAALDKLDWAGAGVASHYAELDTRALSLWLEVLCGKLEAAAKEGRHAEASRRAEVLLYAVASMEPANLPAVRALLRDAELRTLACIERTAASGKLNSATLQRIESRINLLNKAPLPEVENVLLIDGWTERQAARSFGASGPAGNKSGGRAWKDLYARARHLASSTGSKESAPVALARHWKQTRKVGELPETAGGTGTPSAEEAGFIISFCEAHRWMMWRRMTTLSALRLEAYRQKSGKFPENWKHALPGGADLTLVRTQGPCLQLTDSRLPAAKAPAAWLASGTTPPDSSSHLCPLYGSQLAELSHK